MVVVIIVVVALVLLGAGVLVGLRLSARTKERRRVEGEPVAPPREAGRPEPTVEAPSVEARDARLQAPAAPEVEAPPAPVEPEVVLEPEVVERPRLRDRLGRTRSAFSGAFGRIRGRKIDDETWDELEESLLLADVGMFTTTRLLDALRVRAKEESATDPEQLIALLRDEVVALLDAGADRTLHMDGGQANVWMFVGVNGVGKTTTIGKLAQQRVHDGQRVVLAAGDTFRAAAADQLGMWAERTGGELVRGQEGADPGSVVFDAMAAASDAGSISSSSTPPVASTPRAT